MHSGCFAIKCSVAYKYNLASLKTLLLNRKWAENAANGNKNRAGGSGTGVWNVRSCNDPRFSSVFPLIVNIDPLIRICLDRPPICWTIPWYHVIRKLIVDDEPIARRVLRDELAACSEIEIMAEAEDGASAAGLIQELTPDLIFLDLQMPRMMGLDVIQAVRSTTATIVVVTACEDGALSALDGGAAAFLLKPVNPTCMRAILARVRRQQELQSTAKDIPAGPPTGYRFRC